MNIKSTKKKSRPIVRQPKKQKVVIFVIFSLFFSPSAIEIAVDPPFPNNVPIPERIEKMGILREIAAILFESPVCPMK